MHTFLSLLLLIALSTPVSAADPVCVKYGPAVVSLKGSVIYRNFVDAADRPERVPLLLLHDPICVEASGSEFNVDEGDEHLVHLNMKPEVEGGERHLSGRRVTVTGTLYHAHTSHHHAALVLMVSELKVSK